MKILLISYGIKEYDGRLSEIRNMANNIGDVTCVCIGNNKGNGRNEKIIQLKHSKYLSLKIYLTFIYISLKTAHEMKSIDILITDNFFAAIPALLIRAIYKPRKIVQDVRELYFYKNIRNWSGRILCRFESILMKKADVVLCANEQRAKIMYEHYHLQRKPIAFENIRFLTGEYDERLLDDKYKNAFNYEVNIVNTGGLSVARNTDKLIYSIAKLPKNYGLFLIGDGTDEDKRIIKDIIDINKLSNVTLINKVPLPELRYIVQRCDIGIVNYHKNDLNNQYCASGKIYEYLAEGLPIVTTENIPLKEFCEEYGVGEADDHFFNGLLKVSDNIDEYKERVKSFISGVSIEKYNSDISRKIIETIGSNDNYEET